MCTASGSEERPALIAAESDEGKVAASGDALEIFGHRREEGPTLCKERKGQATQEGAFITEWYYLLVGILHGCVLGREEGGKDGPPAKWAESTETKLRG